MKTYIEVGSLADGTRVYRMHCPVCKRVGVWQTNINHAETAQRIHERELHQKREVA